MFDKRNEVHRVVAGEILDTIADAIVEIHTTFDDSTRTLRQAMRETSDPGERDKYERQAQYAQGVLFGVEAVARRVMVLSRVRYHRAPHAKLAAVANADPHVVAELLAEVKQ